MKKIILTTCIILSSVVFGFSQNTEILDSTSLSTKTKMELTQIYLNQVKTLVASIPYSPFSLRDTINQTEIQEINLDIPMTKYTTKKLEKVGDYTEELNGTLQKSLFEIIPYSDKQDIIKAILYVKSINDMMNKIF